MRARYRRRLELLEAHAPEPQPEREPLTPEDVTQIVLNEFRSGRIRFVAPGRVEVTTDTSTGYTDIACRYVNECLIASPTTWVLLADHEYIEIEQWFDSGYMRVWPTGWEGGPTPYLWPGRETWDSWVIEPGIFGTHELAQHFRCALDNWIVQQQTELPEVKTPQMLRDIFGIWKRDFDSYRQELTL